MHSVPACEANKAKGQPDRVTCGNTRLLRSGRSKLGEGQNCERHSSK